MFISDSSRSVAAAHHCFDQQLFRYRHFLPDCTQNETAHRNVWRFNRLRKCRSHSPSRLRHRKADFGDFLSSLVFSVWLLCHFFFICQEAKTGTLKILGDQVRQYPERLFTDQSKINVRLLTGRFAYPHVYIQITKRTNNLIGLFANELDPFFFFFCSSSVATNILQILRYGSIQKGWHLSFSHHQSSAVPERILVNCFAERQPVHIDYWLRVGYVSFSFHHQLTFSDYILIAVQLVVWWRCGKVGCQNSGWTLSFHETNVRQKLNLDGKIKRPVV